MLPYSCYFLSKCAYLRVIESILTRRLSQISSEGMGKMTLTGKTSHESDLVQGKVSLFEEALCSLNTSVHDILVRAFTSRMAKESCEVKRAYSALLSKFS